MVIRQRRRRNLSSVFYSLFPYSLYSNRAGHLIESSTRVPPGEQTLSIPAELASILERLGIVAETLAETVENFPELFRRLAGTVEKMKKRAKELGRKCLHSVRAAARICLGASDS